MTARRWFRIVLAAAVAGNLLAGIGALYLVGAGTDDLTVDEALARFRESHTTAPASPDESGAPSASPTATIAGVKKVPASRPTVRATTKRSTASTVLSETPEEGVYVFDTQGYEETDALSGAHREYPASTTMSIDRTDCGYTWRWQPAEERWDETLGCKTRAGIVLQRFTMYHEFFKRGTTESLKCGDDAVVMPSAPQTGQRWTWRCHSDDTRIVSDTRVVGFENLAVGGRSYRTVRIRYEVAMTGDNEGTQIQERWLRLTDGLLLRIVSDVQARVEVPFGGTANYEEHYRLDLTSVEPMR